MALSYLRDAMRVLKEVSTHSYKLMDEWKQPYTVQCTLCDHVYNFARVPGYDDINCWVVVQNELSERLPGEYAICNSEEEFV